MDNIPSNISAEDVKYVARYQPGEYMAQIPDHAGRINKQTLGSTRVYFEITTPICMYVMRYSFPLQGFMREILVLLSEEAAGGTFTKADPMEFNDTFSQVARGCSPFDFLILSEGK
uniref:Uncharacterized protein n=1 Tax=Populus trichocarpa TaxID=3694 RepID=A0A2K2CBK4_POPTR